MAPPVAPYDPSARCAIDGCTEPSTYRVVRGDHQLSVCRRCTQELVAFLGWTTVAPGETATGNAGAGLIPA